MSAYLTSVAFCILTPPESIYSMCRSEDGYSTHQSLIIPIGGVYLSAPCKLPVMLKGFHSADSRSLPILQPLSGHQSLPASFFASRRSSSLTLRKPTMGSLRKSRSSTTLIVMMLDDRSVHRNSVDDSHTGLLVCLTRGVE